MRLEIPRELPRRTALGCIAFLVALLPLLPAGCARSQRGDRVLIGHPACLSGKHAKEGEQAIAGIQACVDWINTHKGGVRVGSSRRPVEYRYYDCESNREAVGSLLERLITVDRVDVAVAPYTSGLTLAGAPVSEKYGMLYLDHGGASDEIFAQGFRNVVQTIGPGSSYHVGTLNMLHETDPQARRVAFLYEDSEFARIVQQGAVAHAKKLGYEIVFNRNYPIGISDLTPILSAMKAQSPDIVLGGGHFADGQLINRQMADLQFNVKALSLVVAVTLPQFYEALGENAEGVMGPSHWEEGVTYSPAVAAEENLTWYGPTQEEFMAAFEKSAGPGVAPDYHAAEAGAAVLAWALAVERAGTIDTPSVRKALAELQFMSFYGRWDIDETGKQIGHSMVDVQWQNGHREIVWPPPARTAALQYPKPAFGGDSGEMQANGDAADERLQPISISGQVAGNLIQGLVLGAIYGVATMGLSLIFGVLRVVNVGHGALLMLGAYAAWFVTERVGVSPLVALPLAVALGASIGLLFFCTVLHRLLKAPELATLLATFALGVILEEAVKHTFTSEIRGFTWELGGVDLGVTVVQWRSLLAAVGSVAIALGIYAWFHKTRLGIATRAVVQDDLGAAVCGVNVQRIYALTFALGASLAVTGGVLSSMHNPGGIAPSMGHPLTLKAFVIAVLGGLTSPYGAFFAGLLFGLIENGSYLLLAQIPGIEPITMARALSFVLLLIILLVRPTGLMGAR